MANFQFSVFYTNVKINGVNIGNSAHFGAALSTKERKDYEDVLRQGKNALGTKQSVLIVHDPCLPQKSSLRTGVGNLSSDISSQFFDFMKSYIGIDTVEVLPQGEMRPHHKGFYCPYGGSTMSLGEHLINLELLTQNDYGNILTSQDVKSVAEKNNSPKDSLEANFENILPEDSPQNKVLEQAFMAFEALDKNHPLKKEYENFKKENYEALRATPLYEALKKENPGTGKGRWDWDRWDETDKRLLLDNNDETRKRLAFLNEKYANDIEFYMFKQFLAEKSFAQGKEKLNKKGLKLVGDCPMGYSPAEVWANQDAFIMHGKYSFGLPALDPSKMSNPDGSLNEAGKLLEKKFAYAFKHYDGLRIDMSWNYIKPYIESEGLKADMQGQIIKLIEDTAKKVKGEDFNLKDIWHEVEADKTLFGPFTSSGGTLKPIPALEGRCQIFTTAHSGSNWGTVDFFENTAKLEGDDFIIGVGNHDSMPLRHLARDESGKKHEQIAPLSHYMKIHPSELEDPAEFARVKFGEIFSAKKQMYFYMDVLGRDDVFNISGQNDKESFRALVSEDFEKEYHKALQEGWGLNAMDALKNAFIAKGLHKTNKELYEKICNYADKLSEKGALTEEEANRAEKSQNSTENKEEKKSKKKKNAGLIAVTIGTAIVASIMLYSFIKNKIKERKQEKSKNT